MLRYGLRALAVLAENYGKGTVSAKEISEREDISTSFLEQLLAQLRRKGLVKGVRGPGGGFKLVKPPADILISDIVEALEGPVCVARCLVEEEDPAAETCERFDDCPAVPLLRKLEEDLNSVLNSYRLSDLQTMSRKKANRKRSV